MKSLSFRKSSAVDFTTDAAIIPNRVFRSCVEVVDQLHREFRCSELPEFIGDQPAICAAIASRTHPLVAATIDRNLRRHLKGQITRFRASVAYPFTSDDESWVILEWRENDGKEVMGIFDVDEDYPDICNYILHIGVGSKDGPTENRWNKTSLVWKVVDMSSLKSLFQAAQHVLGVLGLPESDAKTLYCEDNNDCSAQEYA